MHTEMRYAVEKRELGLRVAGFDQGAREGTHQVADERDEHAKTDALAYDDAQQRGITRAPLRRLHRLRQTTASATLPTRPGVTLLAPNCSPKKPL